MSEKCHEVNIYRLNFAGYIMKKTLQLVAIGCLLAACNNGAVENQVTQTQVPVQEKEMKDAIAKYPDSGLLKENLIDYYRENGSLELALAETTKALAKDSNDAKLWDKKALIYIENDDTINSIKAYQKAIAIYPDPEYIMALGWLYAQKKDSNALAMADALLVGKKSHAEKEAFLIKGLYYGSVGNTQKALVFFDGCLAMDYTFMQAYREKAIVLYNIGKYEDAIKVLTKAVTLQNSFAEGYYWIGKCNEKLNNTNDAIESYKLALQYDPDLVDAKDALGKLGVK